MNKEKNKKFFHPSFFPKTRRGYFFSLDAFIALLLVLGVILFIKPSVTNVSHEDKIHEDLLQVLSDIKIGDLNNSYAKQLISQGNITNLNLSVLEQIGEFYANSNPAAQTLASSILSDLNLSKNIGIYFNNVPIAVSGSGNYANAESISTTRQIISGIQQGESVRGYSSRAFLSSNNRINYFYFGGYVGDGNITVDLGENVIGANIEGAFSGNFDLYINNQPAGSYSPPKDVPYKISLANYTDKFAVGNNSLDFKSKDNLYVAGGYVKVFYNSTEIPSINERDYFPGITGLINIYQGFYVPASIQTMEVMLHYNSTYNIFLTIGNKTIYEGNSSGLESTVLLDNSSLAGAFSGSYSQLENRTVPLRIGLSNASYSQNITLPVDVFSVDDLSGSMADCVVPYIRCTYYCESPHNPSQHTSSNRKRCDISPSSVCAGTICGSCTNPVSNHSYSNTSSSNCYNTKLDLAKNATKDFVDIILNSSLNRVGLVGYSTTASSTDYHPLSTNNVTLKTEVDSWFTQYNTCICCGINKAVADLVANSSVDKSRAIVLMTDGQANVACPQQGVTPDLNGNGIADDAGDDAIKAACDAFTNYGIKIYSIGFGSDVDENTTSKIALCTGGNYYYSSVNELGDKFRKVAQDVITAAYQEQTIVGQGFSTKLYPDSYIRLGYNLNIPYGLMVGSESEIFGNNISQGSFYIPNDTIPYEAKVISYSGSKWTSKVDVYDSNSSSWNSVFNLGTYGLNFTSLGDPYFVNIPRDKISYGNNTVRVFTGLASGNYSGGSEYDKVIYTLVKDLTSYSQISPHAEGCIWNIEFEDGSFSPIKIPANYSGSNICNYTSSDRSYSETDAVQIAIYNLLSKLDLNSNGKIESKFTESELSLDTTEINGIPFTWDTEVQVRTWR